ncbi:MAG: 50S ribosomal protein L13 [Nanoarchaeota archaeon]
MKIYNGEGMILGRLASLAAKQVLLGEEIHVINCEKVVISGRKANTLAWQHQRRKRKGYPLKSQTHSRLPERLVRRTIRGMLPWKQSRGREAFHLVLCHRGLPAEFIGKEIIEMATSKGTAKESVAKLPTLHYTTVGELCRLLGGKA